MNFKNKQLLLEMISPPVSFLSSSPPPLFPLPTRTHNIPPYNCILPDVNVTDTRKVIVDVYPVELVVLKFDSSQSFYL